MSRDVFLNNFIYLEFNRYVIHENRLLFVHILFSRRRDSQ